uniref:Uncharacterized protein n=1 Tax=Panagrolaimus sp. JU765 TaxID=591449 RepID=A0AC34R6W4_9BILA
MLLLGQNFYNAGWLYDERTKWFSKEYEKVMGSFKPLNIDDSFTLRFNNIDDLFGIHLLKRILFQSLLNKNPNGYKFTDFLIDNYGTWGYFSRFCFVSKRSDEEGFKPKFVYHGLEMFIIFNEKNKLLFENSSSDVFLDKIWKKEQELTEDQKNVVCSVLIISSDPEKTRLSQMKMFEILEFIEEFKNNEHPEYETQISYSTFEKYECFTDITAKKMKPFMHSFHHAEVFFELYWITKLLENRKKRLELRKISLISDKTTFLEYVKEMDMLSLQTETVNDCFQKEEEKLSEYKATGLIKFQDLVPVSPLEQLVELRIGLLNAPLVEKVNISSPVLRYDVLKRAVNVSYKYGNFEDFFWYETNHILQKKYFEEFYELK